MAPNSLSPASVVIDYHSPYGPHKMTIPTRAWNPVPITGDLGSYEPWFGASVDAEVMIMELVTALAELLKTNAAFDNITVFTQATPTSPNIPRVSKGITVAGTATVGVEAAISQTWNFKTNGNGNMKIVLLDCPLLNGWFDRVLPVDFEPEQTAVATAIMLNTNAWAGRDDEDITVIRSITWDLNDKLQKMYFK